MRQVGKADERLLAAHIQQLPPDATTQDADAWWEKATGLLPALLPHRPTAEGARLADYLRSTCLPETAPYLHEQMAAEFGAPPGPVDLAGYDPALVGRPRRAWLRVWDWSPVLPEPVLASWEPVLTLLRRAKPSGPADPRTAGPLVEVTDVPPPVVDETQAAAIAAEHGPAAAADALAAAPDAGDPRYLMVLRTLIEGDPAAWAAAPAEFTARLALPQLRAFYLAIVAEQTAIATLSPATHWPRPSRRPAPRTATPPSPTRSRTRQPRPVPIPTRTSPPRHAWPNRPCSTC
ncbi:hypothetical protein ACFCYB_08005 [Streptomyces sp. NPDC056309]|uniref:hypothetical protein n=1 Tax=unclassified Streptomyces TaxID=2593676 RepID=UPI0035DE912F